jgi:two-component system capsular synthesis response regulator RcsB
MIRVILADDHPVVLLGMKNALEASGDIQVVATADSPDSLLSCLS